MQFNNYNDITDSKTKYLYVKGGEGWLSHRVFQDITHNRTANTFGGAGRNVALDLKCEHSNKDFQGMVGPKVRIINKISTSNGQRHKSYSFTMIMNETPD